MIEELVNKISLNSFQGELISLLEYELKINEKKINKEKLTQDEYFFDTYFVKPSTIYRILLERSKKNEKI